MKALQNLYKGFIKKLHAYMFLRYSLENYTSNNTSTTRHNMRQHEYNTTQHECNTTQYEYKGSSGSKNKALLCTFVTELFIFLISSRNC